MKLTHKKDSHKFAATSIRNHNTLCIIMLLAKIPCKSDISVLKVLFAASADRNILAVVKKNFHIRIINSFDMFHINDNPVVSTRENILIT